MKLQLSVFAQDLKVPKGCSISAIVAKVHPEPDKQPTVIGKTEALRSRKNPDWLKIFILDDYKLGKTMHVIITIHNESANETLGSAMFEIGCVLGTPGGILGKALKDGSSIMAHVERYSGSGFLYLKMRGLNLVSDQENVDAFFELQRKRKTVNDEVVWDAIFRSLPVEDSSNPVWDEICIDLSTLCNGKKKEKFRVAVKDYHDDGDRFSVVGYGRMSVNEILQSVTEGADAEDPGTVNTDKAFVLTKGSGKTKEEVGKIVVTAATISDSEYQSKSSDEPIEEEAEIVVDAMDSTREATEDIEIVADDLFGEANFADYVSGGCQLRAITAIDFTASNGTSPRVFDSSIRIVALRILT